MTDESLPGLHDMLAGLPKARVPFEQATEATYGRLYDAYEKFKALHAEAEAEAERLRTEAADLRTTIALLGDSLNLVGNHAETAESERDQLKAEVRAAMSERHADEIERIVTERRALPDEERRRVEAADAPLLRIQLAATAESVVRLKAGLAAVWAVHVVHECDDCTCRICWGVGSVCEGCGKPAPCPTLQALGPAEDGEPSDLVVVSRSDLRRYFDCEDHDLSASVDGLRRLWTAAGIEDA